MITEDYVSFETAKLLKEKGFDEEIETLIRPDGSIYFLDENNTFSSVRHIKIKNSDINIYSDSVSCPTLQMAMKWLRKEHGLFIRVTEDITGSIFEWSVYQKSYGCRMSTYVEDSYEKACETAIKYCLKILTTLKN